MAQAANNDVTSETYPYRVLVVDDYDLNRDLLRFRLEAMGCDVHESENGERALTLLRESDFDMVLLDVKMPVMDGMEALKAIKEDSKLATIPVIMVSAISEIETVAHCLDNGADDFLTKPFNPVFLKTRVRSCLERKRFQDLHSDTATDIETTSTSHDVPEIVESQEVATDEAEDQSVNLALNARSAALFQLATLAETRASGKGARLERIRHYSLILAEQLASTPTYAEIIDKQFIDDLYDASPLHDIGKISTSETILKKPGKLDAHERASMEKHTTDGADTLRRAQEHAECSFIAMAIDIAQNHHERWDGNGYPGKRQNDDIPLAARIVTLADTFDALTTRSVYKDITSHTELKKVILEERGKQFDPDIVDAYLAKEGEFSRIQVKHHDPITKHA